MDGNENWKRWFIRRVSLLCVITLVLQIAPSPFAPETSVQAQAVEPVRSNHAAQIKVTGPSGARVNTWTGNLFFPLSLLIIPGRRLPIQLSLSYNSSWRNFNAGHYGYGWQLSYNVFYLREPDGSITIVWEDGRSDTFVKDGTNFLPPSDVYASLIEYQPYKYKLLTKDGLEYFFDGWHDKLTKIREPNGNTLTFTYTNIYSLPNQFVAQTTIPYYPVLTSITDASGRQIQLAYTDSHLTTITDPNSSPSRTIQLGYDANNNLISVTDSAGGVTAFGYNAEHFLTTITPPVGAPTSITYTNAAVTQVSGELTTKSFAYDTTNHITTMTDTAPEGDQVTRFYYDAQGRINEIEDPLNNSTSMVWGDNNNLISFTDALNRATSYTYDTSGNLLSVTDPLSHTTSYTYEPVYNRLTSMTDALGHTTTYTYDSLGNLLSESDSLGHTTSYTYNSAGDVVTRIDANGQTTTYQYNSHGDLTNIIYPVGNATYTYDNVGNLTGMANADANMLYTYDSLNRVQNTNVTTYGKSTTYTYDAFGNRTSMTDPDGGVTTYTYDSANRLISLTNPLSQTTTFIYDSRGRLTRKNLANGTYALYTYDLANHLLSLVNKKSNGTVISSYTYEYDTVGNRTKMTEADGGVTTYTYDALNQLTKVVYPDATFQEFTYDAVGNRLSMTDEAGTITYTYDNANRLLNTGSTTYGWDNNGNQISKTEGTDITTYNYDFENRLTSIALPDGGTNTFTYYSDGRRLSKTDSGGQTTRYFYDGPNAIIETDNIGITVARYTSGLGVDKWISMDRSNASYFYHQDGLGSVTDLTNSNENNAVAYRYKIFGKIRYQLGNLVNPNQFTGREYDKGTGLYYLRSRYYDDQIGRFLSFDPLGLTAGVNSYAYVLNDPVNYIDPFGLYGISIYPMANIIGIPSIGVIADPGIGVWPGGDWGGFWYFLWWWHFGGKDDTNPRDPRNWPDPNDRPKPVDEDPPGKPPQPPPYGGFNPAGGCPGGGGCAGDPPSGGSGGGGGGGVESRPINIAPSYFLGKPEPKPKSVPKIQAQNLISLDDILPQTGPLNTTPNVYTPTLVLAFNDVTTARAIDFVQGSTSLIKGAILGIETQNTTYEHDYTVCRRFQGYAMDTVVPVMIPGPSGEEAWFWHSTSYNGEFIEETFTFTVFVKESTKTFTIDSRWTYEDYQQSLPTHDYIFNIRIWAPNVLDAYALVRQTLANLDSFDGGSWNLIFANTTEPQTPVVFIEKGQQFGSEIHLTMRNWSGTPQNVTFSGGWRSYLDRETIINFTQTVSVSPGISTVVLSFPNVLDAVIYSDDGSFKDKVYVGSGFWFAFDDSNQPWTPSQVTRFESQCTAPTGMGNDALIIPGCSGMTGTINDSRGYVGLGVTINPNGLPVDISKYGALTFRAKGDGRSYRLKIETASVQDGDFHEIVITPPNGTWRQYVIPFTEFQQRVGTNPVTFTGTDVKAIVWVAEGRIPNSSVNFEIDQLAFFNSTILSNVTGPASTNSVYGPYPITAKIVDDGTTITKTLHYSVNGGNTFETLVMNPVGADVYKAQIPGQAMGTIIKYYIEAADNDGNKATFPPDAPWTTRQFKVESLPSLLVDDFYDFSLVNVLRGDSGISVQGGTGEISFTNGVMCFAYDITATNGWVVYYSLLKRLNATSYHSISFDIRGLQGGEIAKFGLNDGQGHEVKLEINEYLPNGITTQWQKVTIPIDAFTNVIASTSNLHSLSLAFEDSIGSGQGTVCLDNIRFDSLGAPIHVDNFNDKDSQNGVGLNHAVDVGGGGTINVSYDTLNPYSGVGASLKLDYNVPAVGFAAWQSGLDNNLSIGYDKLLFMVYGAAGGETFHVWLGDGANHSAWVNITDYVTITQDWQQVEIPLQDFASQGVNLQYLAFFKIAFEWSSMSGTVYLDDIRFKVDPAPLTLSIASANPNPTNAAIVNFTVTFSESVTGVDMLSG